MRPPNQHDTEIPILTDILHEEVARPEVTYEAAASETSAEDAELLRAIEEEISARIAAELSDQIPVLIEAALQEHLPQAVGSKLQAEIMTALAATLPLAAEAATEQVAGTLAQEIGALLEQRLEIRVREVVSQEFSRLQQP
ncbi:MAG: hypothetical protein ACKOAO_06600 [Oxalobacteraceae bacterium]